MSARQQIDEIELYLPASILDANGVATGLPVVMMRPDGTTSTVGAIPFSVPSSDAVLAGSVVSMGAARVRYVAVLNPNPASFFLNFYDANDVGDIGSGTFRWHVEVPANGGWDLLVPSDLNLQFDNGVALNVSLNADRSGEAASPPNAIVGLLEPVV